MKKTMLSFCILLSLSCGVFSAQAGDTAELGMHHTVSTLHYIDSSGTVKTWSGEAIPLPGRATDISASERGDSVFAVLEDGTVYAWGRNDMVSSVWATNNHAMHRLQSRDSAT